MNLNILVCPQVILVTTVKVYFQREFGTVESIMGSMVAVCDADLGLTLRVYVSGGDGLTTNCA